MNKLAGFLISWSFHGVGWGGRQAKIITKCDHGSIGSHRGKETEGNWRRSLEINRTLLGSDI